uniref:Uncharacterized protein n=1 Tax=Ascaris lumbricoides TaxID=6252 RepID=A0A9J2PF99_ASCLU
MHGFQAERTSTARSTLWIAIEEYMKKIGEEVIILTLTMSTAIDVMDNLVASDTSKGSCVPSQIVPDQPLLPNLPAERSGERTDTSLGPRYDSMVDSIKDAFTSRFRRQRRKQSSFWLSKFPQTRCVIGPGNVVTAERSGERTDTSLGPRYDSMVDSIKDAFTSRFRRQRRKQSSFWLSKFPQTRCVIGPGNVVTMAAEDTMPDHSLAGDGQEPVLETGIARTETEEGTPDVHTALLRTEGTSMADDEEARAEEEERKRRMRLLRLRTEEEEENVDVDLYHFRRQWTHRPRFSIVLFKLFLASFCVLLNVFHLLHAFSVLPPAFTIFSLQRASYQEEVGIILNAASSFYPIRVASRSTKELYFKEAVDISRVNLKQMLRDRVGIVVRWSPYATAIEDAQYDRCFVLVNNNLWSAWAPYGSKESQNCGTHLYIRYRMLRIFLSPEISKYSQIRCPPTVQYRWQWREACCPAGNPSLESLVNLAEGGLSDMICTQRDPAMVNASNLAHTCKRGTKPWCPLPTAIEVRNGYVYAKPTMVKSYELLYKTVLRKYWINVRRISHRWFMDGELIEFDTLSGKCGQHCYNMVGFRILSFFAFHLISELLTSLTSNVRRTHNQ